MLDDETLERALRDYREIGFARLGKPFPPHVIEGLKERADEIMLAKVVYEGMFFQLDGTSGRYEDLEFGRGFEGPSLHYRKIEKLEKDPRFFEVIASSEYKRVLRALLPEGDISIYRAVLFNKSDRGGSHLPWHQDGGKFWGVDRDPEISIWLALDDAPEEAGCMDIVPGTHRQGLVTPLGGNVSSAFTQREKAEERKVSVPAEAGEAILLHNMVWHRSGLNTTGKPRRALTVCYMDGKTKCLRKKRAPRAFVKVFE